jgi:methylenetetrahydrofolate--tRNA-(uracil-5-)-methyltransferase
LLGPTLELKKTRHPVGADEVGSHERDPEKASAKGAHIMDPRSLSSASQSRGDDKQVIRFAGQITGCEGYVESASMGLITGRFAAAELLGQAPEIPPQTTAMGALLGHITGGADADTFQPMNINFGLFPPLTRAEATFEYVNKKGKTKRAKLKGADRKKAYTTRAIRDFESWKSVKNKAA